MYILLQIVCILKSGTHGIINLVISRKFSLDIIYSLSVIFPHYFRVNEQFINKIGELRFDKIKHVRDAALVAMSSLKDSRSL